MSPRAVVGRTAAVILPLFFLAWPVGLQAQQAADVARAAAPLPATALLPEPPTRLEAFMVRTGVLMISGASRFGAVRGEPGSWIAVATKELTDAQTGERALGVAVEVRRSERRDPDRVSYVDVDELPALLGGLEAMSRLDRTATTLEQFEAHYVTKGGLVFTVYQTSSGLRSAVGTGLAATSMTEVDYGDFQRLRLLLQSAYEGLKALAPQ